MPSSAPMEGAVRCSANYTPLTPISFLERAASVYADRAALVAGGGRAARTWQETRARCLRLAAALAGLGVARHDVVAIFAQNIPAVCELQFGIPMAGAVICALNFRLDSAMASVLLQHSEAKVIFVDHELFNAVQEALRLMSNAGAGPPLVVLIKDDAESPPGADVNATIQVDYEYESFLRNGSPDFEIRWPIDENDPIALNYTSGTTSRPKGVIYSHRATYLNAIATVLLNDMTAMPVYLWTVPMFHCNGWCLVWGLAAQGGMNICIRKVSAKAIFDNIARHKVTHMGGAPTVLNMIVNATADEQKPLPGRVTVMTGGAPPPPQVLFKMDELGFLVIHSYGLTETIGPATYCAWKPEWDGLPPEQRAKIKARQGLHHLGLEVDIKDPVTMRNVPADEKTMGEVMFRGNTIMSGYYKDLKATQESLAGGWYRSGDLAVRHADGYIKLKDRSKDIIISGGENISTIEVESVLFSHPAVLDAAVVGRPDDYWGETPCAFVTLKEDTADATAAEIIAFCRARLPHYMAPRTVVFQELPKTSTGKTQKFVLREQAKAMGSLPRPAGSGSKL